MAQFYFDPRRESDPRALPDGEIWYIAPDSFPLHTIFECGSCGGYHNVYSSCDCRDDSQRYEGVEDYAKRNGLLERQVNETDTPSVGWYWQAGYTGCVPDGDPEGPFDTEAEALADAQSDVMLSDPDDDDPRIGKLHTSAAACIARIENGASLNDALSWLDEEIDEIMSGGDPFDEDRDADGLPPCARVV
jgi:hypothetical protein